jgi:hypothetical protein
MHSCWNVAVGEFMKKYLVVLVACSLVFSSLNAWAGDDEKRAPNLPYSYRSPVAAGLLSIVPGAGQVYNRQYVLGGIYFTGAAGLYIAAIAYTGVFEPETKPRLGYEAAFLFALAGGIHLLSIFDATMEAVRMNETLDRWSVMVDPADRGFSLAYRVRF